MRSSAVILLLLLIGSSVSANPFADNVVSYVPGPGPFTGDPQFNNPTRALGRPYGLGCQVQDNTSVVTLGDGGRMTLSFNQPIFDDPRNPGGYDFIVFSNCIWVGCNPTYRWQELAYIEISQDGVTWYLILPNILPANLVGDVDTGPSHTIVRNYAEYTFTKALPANRHPEEFYTVPDRQSFEDDPRSLLIDEISGGGDAFDIAQAVREISPGVPELDDQGRPVPAGIDWFRYVRITDALVGDEDPIYGMITAEIDAVAQVVPAMTASEARGLADGSFVLLDGFVSGTFDGFFYLEDKDRAGGIRIDGASVTEGQHLLVSGHISTIDGERQVTDALITSLP